MEPSTSAIALPLSFTLLFFLVVAVALLAALLLALRGTRIPVKNLSELEDSAHRVDLPAFRNLLDKEEELFLRENLDPVDFRRIQRQRIRTACEYVRRTAANASAVLSLGEAVRLQSQPEAAAAGRKLLDCAATLRLNAMLALMMLNLQIVFPSMHISPGQVIDGYERFRTAAERLIQLQGPAHETCVLAAI